MYDVIIVGAGPAGLFCAYELIEKNPKLKIIMLDKGHLVENRICPMNKFKTECKNCNPCNILSSHSYQKNKQVRNVCLFDSPKRQNQTFYLLIERLLLQYKMY